MIFPSLSRQNWVNTTANKRVLPNSIFINHDCHNISTKCQVLNYESWLALWTGHEYKNHKQHLKLLLHRARYKQSGLGTEDAGFESRQWKISLLHNIQTGSGAHLAFYSKGIGGTSGR
jgi:hypothetical protein